MTNTEDILYSINRQEKVSRVLHGAAKIICLASMQQGSYSAEASLPELSQERFENEEACVVCGRRSQIGGLCNVDEAKGGLRVADEEKQRLDNGR